MSLLLDTHAFLWAVGQGRRLSGRVADRLGSDREAVLISAVCIWEIAIKSSLGKLEAPDDPLGAIAKFDYVDLPVSSAHAWQVRSLPNHHRDPFDRLLIAQAQVERATIVTADPAFGAYDVEVLW